MALRGSTHVEDLDPLAWDLQTFPDQSDVGILVVAGPAHYERGSQKHAPIYTRILFERNRFPARVGAKPLRIRVDSEVELLGTVCVVRDRL